MSRKSVLEASDNCGQITGTRSGGQCFKFAGQVAVKTTFLLADSCLSGRGNYKVFKI